MRNISRGLQLRAQLRDRLQTTAMSSYRRFSDPTNIRWTRCVILGCERPHAPHANVCCELVSRNHLPANSYRQPNNISPLPRLPETVAKLSSSRSAARACTSCRMAPLRENRLACSWTLTTPTSCRNLMLVTEIASKKPGYARYPEKHLHTVRHAATLISNAWGNLQESTRVLDLRITQ